MNWFLEFIVVAVGLFIGISMIMTGLIFWEIGDHGRLSKIPYATLMGLGFFCIKFSMTDYVSVVEWFRRKF